MPDEENNRPFRVLLIEDNPAEARLTIEVFKEAEINCSVAVVSDGRSAIAYLRQQGEYSHVERPELILLDLKLPKMSGKEVLAIIKNDSELMSIPVVMLTTSRAEEDILQCYNLHANCYITKPVSINDFLNVIKLLGDFWFGVVMLPPNNMSGGDNLKCVL